MASKKFRNKTCVYCHVPNSSSTRDHVFAETFFDRVARPALPQVPACEECQKNKSDLEKYLGAVLPFASKLRDSKRILSESIPKRLKKDLKLHKELVRGSSRKWALNSKSGLILPVVESIPFDGQKFDEWLQYVVQGLSWYYFKVNFLRNKITVNLLRADDNRCSVFDEFLRRCSTVTENLSEVFVFRVGAGGSLMVWEFVILGGLEFNERKKHSDRIFCSIQIT